jgi:hypothetical protein
VRLRIDNLTAIVEAWLLPRYTAPSAESLLAEPVSPEVQCHPSPARGAPPLEINVTSYDVPFCVSHPCLIFPFSCLCLLYLLVPFAWTVREFVWSDAQPTRQRIGELAAVCVAALMAGWWEEERPK